MPSSCFVSGIVTFDCIGPLLQTAVSWIFTFAGIIAFLFIIYAGIRFITSGGDAKQVESARKILTYAIIGLLIILSAFFIINIIADFTGVTCIKMFGFNSCGSATDTGGGTSVNDHCNAGSYCVARNVCNSTNDLQTDSGTCYYSNQVCCKDRVNTPTIGCPSDTYPGGTCSSAICTYGEYAESTTGFANCSVPYCCKPAPAPPPSSLGCPSTTYPGGTCSSAICTYGEYAESATGFANCSVPYCCKPAAPTYITCPTADACLTATVCHQVGGSTQSSLGLCASGKYCCAGL